MLDFRYHALSLVAVFLALAIGIVLGVTIGDSLLTDAERSLRSNLSRDVSNALSGERQAQTALGARDRMLDQLYPGLVRGRLRGERIALLSWGPLPDGVEKGVRDAISQGRGRLDSVSVYDTPLTTLQQLLGSDRFGAMTADQQSLQALGTTLADDIIDGGELGPRLRNTAPDSFSGRFSGADAIVFYEAPDPSDGSDAAGVKERSDSRAQTIEQALLQELQKRTLAVVGVETSDADPSQIPRYESLKLSSVDSVDASGGKIALVFTLAGAQGNYGFKSTAQQPLPDDALTPTSASP